MLHSAKFFIGGASALLLTTAVLAQVPAGRPAQTPQTPPEQPTFRASINLVTTDVIARDSRGQFVSDLKPSEFEILEDGVKQELASLVMVHGGRAYNQQAPAPPPAQEGIILPVARPTNDAAGRIFIFFVDDLHLTFRDTARVRDLFKRMSKTLLHEGDMFGIVSTGPSSLSIQLTYDRKVLEDAIERMTGDGLRPSDILEQSAGPNGPQELRYRAHVAFSTAYDLVQNLEKLHNRRKAIVYVSSGYDFNPFETSRIKQEQERFGGGMSDDGTAQSQHSNPFAGPRSDQGGAQFAQTDLAIELMELTRAANRANATLYTIDPRGLVAGMDLDEQVEQVDWNNYVQRTQDSLRTLAELTGGIAVVNSNDFDKALKRIDAETSDYYVLGYYSTNPDPLRRTRRIEIKAKRSGLQVWSRTAYSLPAPAGPAK